jgi:hypothetical protein
MHVEMSPETDTRERVIRSEGKIDYLVKAFEDFVRESKESRGRMYRELEDARSNATSIKLKIEDLEDRFDPQADLCLFMLSAAMTSMHSRYHSQVTHLPTFPARRR